MKTPPNQTEFESAPDKRNHTAKLQQETLFPELAPTPLQPSPNTLASCLLALFKAGHALTHPEFEAISGSWRLAAVVLELKQLNWRIADCRIGHTRVKRYWLEAGAQW